MKINRPAGEQQAERETLCPDCGAAHAADDSGNPRCAECRQVENREIERDRLRSQTTAERGYGHRWQQLSKRARRLQDFCSDCGSPEDLTVDHSMRAWAAHEAGKTITLDMVDVVCSRCNTERGAARGVDASDVHRLDQREQLARIQSDSEL